MRSKGGYLGRGARNAHTVSAMRGEQIADRRNDIQEGRSNEIRVGRRMSTDRIRIGIAVDLVVGIIRAWAVRIEQ